jgi:hypothetical protein
MSTDPTGELRAQLQSLLDYPIPRGSTSSEPAEEVLIPLIELITDLERQA